MKNYWEQHYDSNSRQFDGSLLKQVGKTINGQEISETQFKLVVKNVINNLHLDSNDSIVDLCCGNGLITRELAPLVKEIVAIDFSQGLIEAAKEYNGFHNIEYINSDVLRLDPKYFLGLKKVIMYEALQLFSGEQLSSLLDTFSNLELGSLVFFGSVPNKEKLNAYYDTKEKYEFYERSERDGKPHMGHWWLIEEIEQIVSGSKFKVIFLPQETTLYTAYYRFDVLLEKCQ
jgi:cyclopropane fatty-acyl-phospholipid synthase-like methyltransferase